MICQTQIKKDIEVLKHFTCSKQFNCEIHFKKKLKLYAHHGPVLHTNLSVLWSWGMHLVPFLDVITEQHMRLFHLILV